MCWSSGAPGAVALASYQHDLLGFALLYATGCGMIAALGFYHVTRPAAIRVAPGAPERAVVWWWRDTIRVLAAIAAIVFLATAVDVILVYQVP